MYLNVVSLEEAVEYNDKKHVFMNFQYKYNIEENQAFNLKKINFSNSFEALISPDKALHSNTLYGGPSVHKLDKRLKKQLLSMSDIIIKEIPKKYLFFYGMMKHLEILSEEIDKLAKTSLNL